jgi:DNA-binding GntR family transcriptional regulator
MTRKKLKKVEIQNYKPLGEVVFDYLRNAILSGDLKPGERLMEISLAEQLGVSRTPVREAIRKLELENFVEMIPRKGAYVAQLKAKDILDILEIRALFDGYAASAAAEQMTDDEVRSLGATLDKFNKAVLKGDKQAMIDTDNRFHDQLLQATKNRKLIDIVNSLQDQFQRFRIIYFNEFDNYEDMQSSHQDLYDAISRRDIRSARERAEKHIKIVENSVIRMEKDR